MEAGSWAPSPSDVSQGHVDVDGHVGSHHSCRESKTAHLPQVSPGVNRDDRSVLRTWGACDGAETQGWADRGRGREQRSLWRPRQEQALQRALLPPPLQPVAASTPGEPAPWVPRPHASVREPVPDRVSLPESPPDLGPRPPDPIDKPRFCLEQRAGGSCALVHSPLLLASSLDRPQGLCTRPHTREVSVGAGCRRPGRVASPRVGGESQ